jgi:hypothetical protein
MITIEQTLTVPDNHRLTVQLPPDAPIGPVRVILQFPVVEAGDSEEKAILAAEKRLSELNRKYPVYVCQSLEEAEDAIARQNTPEAREAFHQMLKRTHGALRNGKAWGEGIDVDAKIQSIRDEWGSNE